MAGTLTVTTKELKDQFGSKRFLILFGFMVLLSVLAAYQGVDYIKNNTSATFNYIFSGARMSFSFNQIMVLFGPILGMALGFDAINKERSSGTLSVLLGQPIYRDTVINGKFLAGAAALATLSTGTIAIMCGITIPLLGFGPTLAEFSKILVITVLTIIYLVFWLSLGILFSVVAKKTSTSILYSIATWMFFAIVLSILASAVAGVLVPLPSSDIVVTESEGGGRGFKMTEEYRDAMIERNVIQSNILRISPTEIYQNTINDILGVAGGFGGMGSMGSQGFERTMSLTEALAANWANITALTVGLVICFAASYMMFLRSEIRPGD